MNTSWKILFLVPVLACTSISAETILIPAGRQGEETVTNLPARGTLKSEVRRILGDPVRTGPAVGEPPISSWEYEDFTVYFEYDHVIHAVKKHRPSYPEAMD